MRTEKRDLSLYLPYFFITANECWLRRWAKPIGLPEKKRAGAPFYRTGKEPGLLFIEQVK
jgi:hypothetical protein